MRLIDADALYYKVKCECNPYGKPSIDFESGKKVLNWIEQARTVERPTCETCTMWDANHRYCTGWESFMEAEDYCSEHEDKEGDGK